MVIRHSSDPYESLFYISEARKSSKTVLPTQLKTLSKQCEIIQRSCGSQEGEAGQKSRVENTGIIASWMLSKQGNITPAALFSDQMLIRALEHDKRFSHTTILVRHVCGVRNLVWKTLDSSHRRRSPF
ncbi:hypothetical protein M758_9G041600 [Ceratodon purpureus]|nr:hypothetical protein M758_9G041600 [Ceratodon purpureus]